jgi:hypothetical protein
MAEESLPQEEAPLGYGRLLIRTAFADGSLGFTLRILVGLAIGLAFAGGFPVAGCVLCVAGIGLSLQEVDRAR